GAPWAPDLDSSKIPDRVKCANRGGSLILSGGTGAPAEVRFIVPREAHHEPGYRWAVLAAVLGTAVLARLMAKEAKAKWTQGLPIDKPWKVDDNWLTNISTLGAILGTVLTTTGFVQDWLPGVTLGTLLGLNLLFSAMVLFAPVIYSASCKWELKKNDKGQDVLTAEGKGWGLVFAALVTLAGVFGQLSTVGALTLSSATNLWIKIGLLVLLGVAAIFVGFYAHSFVRGTLGAAGTASSQRGQTRSAAL
ncbi:hypothetical protein, partial [Streptomyces sp. NPDC058621]